MKWTPEAIDRLRALWAEGNSHSACARELSAEFGEPVSPGMAAGKVHRLQLERRNGAARCEVRPTRERAPARLPPGTREPPPAPPAPPPRPHPSRVVGSARGCLWPTGTPSAPLSCGAVCARNRPYCDAHCAVAYAPRPAIAGRPAPGA